MWKRTFGIYKNIRIPWILYFLQVILGIISTKTALLYVPYEADLKLGNLSDIHVVLGYAGLLLLAVVIKAAESIPAFYAEGQLTRNLRNKLIGHSLRLPVRTLEQTGSKIASWITEDCTYANGLITSIIGFITGIAATYMSMTSMSSIDQSMLFIVPVILVYILFSTWLEGRIMFLRERRGRDAFKG
jgi:ABC-type multidrug transport system fused ATPase/permease subunit